jgi:hypothetical protein
MLFADRRVGPDAWILLAHAVASGNVVAFRRDLVCVVFVLLLAKLQTVPDNDRTGFEPTFVCGSLSLDSQLLSFNVFKIATEISG